MMIAWPAKADEIAELKAEMKAQKVKIKVLETHLLQLEQKKIHSQAAAAPAPGPIVTEEEAPPVAPPFWNPLVSGRPVHIVETAGTEITMYGLVEATISGVTNAAPNGDSKLGFQTAWFSGNRWGLYGKTVMFPEYGLNFIARLESEFESPTGNMDTNGVLFNRDAWIGFESEFLGKLTFGRQNTLPRDFSNIWGDPYTSASLSTAEGGYTNVNNFKQLIFYSGGGSGAHGYGDTRLDNGIVWKKMFDSGLVLGAAYAFSDGNGPGGPNGSGTIPGAGFGRGSVQSAAIGYNGGPFHISAFWNHTNVLEAVNGVYTNNGLSHMSEGIGGNYEFDFFGLGVLRWNAGYIHYTADQGFVGTRTDNAVTTSIKFTPPGLFDYEVGWQDFYAHNAAFTPGGFTFNPYQDASGATDAGSGSRMTVYGSIIYHPVPTIDIYLAGDYLRTTGEYIASQANGHNNATEVATGVRWKF